MQWNRRSPAVIMAIFGFGSLSTSAGPVSFKAEIAPILLEKCQTCHGPKKSKGKYRVDSYTRAIKTGAKEIHSRVSTDDEDEVMPAKGERLKPEQIALFKRWMDEGAKHDGDDPDASLFDITPGVTHPAAPESYARPIPIPALTFSPEGELLFVGGYREITVWNIGGVLRRRIGNLPERIQSIDVSPDGTRLAVAGGIPGRLGEVRVLDAASGELLRTLHKSGDLCFSARFSPDGARLASGGADGTIRVFKTATWKPEIVFSNHSDWVNEITWNAEGTRIASASRDHTAKVFDLAKRKRLATYTGHNKSVYAVRFHPTEANEVFSGAADGRLMRWRINDGGTVKEYLTQPEAIFDIAEIRTTEHLVIASGDPTVLAMHWNDPGKRRPLEAGTQAGLSLAASPGGDLLASGDRNGMVRIWETTKGALLTEFEGRP